MSRLIIACLSQFCAQIKASVILGEMDYLNVSKTRPPVLNADSEATVDTGTANTSRAMQEIMDHISDEELAKIICWRLGMILEMPKICFKFAMDMYYNTKRISQKSYTYDSYARRARLRPTKNILVNEQVSIFRHILSHHVKNRVVQFEFERSEETVSRHFNSILNGMMLLVDELFKQPELIPEDSTDEQWKWFKGCLGAIDRTYIRIKVPLEEQGKYRNRKGEITTNVRGNNALNTVETQPLFEDTALNPVETQPLFEDTPIEDATPSHQFNHPMIGVLGAID
ncbi:protein ALP1-like [Senna tora]|uniref:Protein ALP1-like n=1 Tax=Senna tora TaxID=362788 RepID=A0A834WA26_9FABA|nr:protein ALP1-like [Senna tora]